jgi:hypothetical protein
MTDGVSLELALKTEGLEVDHQGNFECPSCSEWVDVTWGCLECEERGDCPPVLNPWKLVSWAEQQYDAGFIVAPDELIGLFVERSGEVEAPVACFVDARGQTLLIFGNNFAGTVRSIDEQKVKRPRAGDLAPWHSVVQYPFHLKGEDCVLHDDSQIVVWARAARDAGEFAKMMSLAEFIKNYQLAPFGIEWEGNRLAWWPEDVYGGDE